MKEYIIVYREQGQMGWDKRRYGSVKANSEEEARAAFEKWADRPSQYRRTLIKLAEVIE